MIHKPKDPVVATSLSLLKLREQSKYPEDLLAQRRIKHVAQVEETINKEYIKDWKIIQNSGRTPEKV